MAQTTEEFGHLLKEVWGIDFPEDLPVYLTSRTGLLLGAYAITWDGGRGFGQACRYKGYEYIYDENCSAYIRRDEYLRTDSPNHQENGW